MNLQNLGFLLIFRLPHNNLNRLLEIAQSFARFSQSSPNSKLLAQNNSAHVRDNKKDGPSDVD